MKHKTFKNVVGKSIRALTQVSDSTSIKNAPAVQKANEKMHSVGLKVA